MIILGKHFLNVGSLECLQMLIFTERVPSCSRKQFLTIGNFYGNSLSGKAQSLELS